MEANAGFDGAAIDDVPDSDDATAKENSSSDNSYNDALHVQIGDYKQALENIDASADQNHLIVSHQFDTTNSMPEQSSAIFAPYIKENVQIFYSEFSKMPQCPPSPRKLYISMKICNCVELDTVMVTSTVNLLAHKCPSTKSSQQISSTHSLVYSEEQKNPPK
jgi:hypothetical protein